MPADDRLSPARGASHSDPTADHHPTNASSTFHLTFTGASDLTIGPGYCR